MLRKVKKYLKFVVCCGLILSLIAPSYAALSASDGSAFVTKAEFDSALADFNARLTTFEAGINSKIDSQVSSYLDRNGIWNGQQQDFDIVEKYKALGKWTADWAGTSWHVSKGAWSQFEQWNNYMTEAMLMPDQEQTKIITWKNGEKTYTATYDRGVSTGYYNVYQRLYFFDDAFVAKKSGLCFYQICLSGGNLVRWFTPDGCYVDTNLCGLVNEDIDYYYKQRLNRQDPRLFSFWYVVSDKEAEFGERDETTLYRYTNGGSSWEYMPQWAIGIQNISWSQAIPISGNFFVEKGKSYGCGLRPFYCWSSSDYEWFLDDKQKVWDKGANAKLYFGPSSNQYARFVPSLSIY